MIQGRVIRHQFRRNGLNHLVICHDVVDDGSDYHVAFPPTLCGLEFSIGSGGWGHGPKNCAACFALGAPAVRIPFPQRSMP